MAAPRLDAFGWGTCASLVWGLLWAALPGYAEHCSLGAVNGTGLTYTSPHLSRMKVLCSQQRIFVLAILGKGISFGNDEY